MNYVCARQNKCVKCHITLDNSPVAEKQHFKTRKRPYASRLTELKLHESHILVLFFSFLNSPFTKNVSHYYRLTVLRWAYGTQPICRLHVQRYENTAFMGSKYTSIRIGYLYEY